MASTKVGSAGRYGARYGIKARKKVSDMERDNKSRFTCPFCLKKTARRLALGIFECAKCSAKFAGKAYSP
ncbi:50S ribosomal protein L37ae [archaeon CG10_big_fil_rev_8_21_14_0_10_43_11]|nr:MAG: 50S ribosomal protein L37ae [archaeon CG10_big_fil_rev_8_21_14_0_10_43_11]